MLKLNWIAAVTLSCVSICCPAQVAKDVDPLLGNDGGGNTFPGAAVPFGMIKPGPDMGDNTGNAGWKPQGNINGFSQTHVSGTGGGAKYGNILVQPTVGDVSPADSGSPGIDERASAGFYGVTLTRFPVGVEITSARRTALYRFTYPAAHKANILFDVSHLLSSYANQGENQRLVASAIHISSPREVTGWTSVTGGWNLQSSVYTVYFYAVTDTPATSWGTWCGRELDKSSDDSSGNGKDSGGWLSFATTNHQQVQLKLGISFISVEKARQNALAEVSAIDFDEVHAQAVALWEKALAPIEVGGAAPAQKQQFYTALYHTMLMPADRSGENPLWQSSEPYYDDFYAIWDTFRTSGPLLTLIAPERETQMVRALVDIYRHDGWLPDARSGNSNGRTQGGSNADFVVADAYVKGLQGIDWADAYAAVVKDAEVTPPDQIKEGRGDLDEWKKLDYLSMEGVDRPGSKQMDYAADDFEVATLAKGLNKTGDYTKYLKRSGNWENLWDADAKDGIFSGFIWPRHRDGSWKANFNGLEGCSWGGDTFYEGNSWTYSTYVPHDVARVVAKSGGQQSFVRRLDSFFAVPGRYDVGNEPGFLAPYLYLWAGRPDRTAEHLRAIIAENFHAGRKGLPGNDDSGAMSSWYAFGMMGFYPNAGQDVYVIGSPAFPEISIHLSNGKTFTIIARDVSSENKYVASAEWDGKPYAETWFRHCDILKGGQLVLTMSATPSGWGSKSAPPSASDNR